MASKYIIQNNEIRMGNVEFHSQLKSKTNNPVRGGGYFHISDKDKYIIFYSESVDYGAVNCDELVPALENSLLSSRLNGYDVLYSTYMLLGDALKNNKIIWNIPKDFMI